MMRVPLLLLSILGIGAVAASAQPNPPATSVQAPRDVATGQASGVQAPRDVASGQASGARARIPGQAQPGLLNKQEMDIGLATAPPPSVQSSPSAGMPAMNMQFRREGAPSSQQTAGTTAGAQGAAGFTGGTNDGQSIRRREPDGVAQVGLHGAGQVAATPAPGQTTSFGDTPGLQGGDMVSGRQRSSQFIGGSDDGQSISRDTGNVPDTASQFQGGAGDGQSMRHRQAGQGQRLNRRRRGR